MIRPREYVPVILDSFKRTVGSDNNFSITLLRPINHISELEITDINLPLSYYNININTNILKLEHPVSTVITAIIPVGDYNGDTLAATLATELNSISGGFTVTFDKDTYKFTFTNPTDFILLSLVNDSQSLLWPYLGFSTQQAASMVQTSDTVVNLSSPRYIKIKSTVLGGIHQRIHKTQFGDGFMGIEDETILTIFPDKTFGCILVKSGIKEIIRYEHSFSITSIDLSLWDENDNALNINGNSWILAIRLSIR